MNRTQLHIAVQVLAWTSIAIAPGLAAQETDRGEAPAPSAVELTSEQKEQFLLHAKVVKMRGTKIGVTGSQRATASGGVTHCQIPAAVPAIANRTNAARIPPETNRQQLSSCP